MGDAPGVVDLRGGLEPNRVFFLVPPALPGGLPLQPRPAVAAAAKSLILQKNPILELLII